MQTTRRALLQSAPATALALAAPAALAAEPDGKVFYSDAALELALDIRAQLDQLEARVRPFLGGVSPAFQALLETYEQASAAYDAVLGQDLPDEQVNGPHDAKDCAYWAVVNEPAETLSELAEKAGVIQDWTIDIDCPPDDREVVALLEDIYRLAGRVGT
ncbi:MAG: hypothetical protein ACFCUQ_09410 [Kiloniellales bacterium]